MVYFKTKKRNTPIATLIKNYVNKKSGKVSDSRDEIQLRFDYLDWKDQKKIILAFLESGKTDRQWAYSKVLDYWDKSFEPKIKELWEQLYEDKCAWVVIRHFPLEYLSQNIDMFTGDRDYYFVCLRLAEDKDFVIDKDRLSLTDYLAVLYHTDRSITDEEAMDIPYIIVHKLCVECVFGYGELDRFANTRRGNVISPGNFHKVSLANYYLKKLNCTQVILQFEEWNKKVQEAIFASPEFKAISNADLDDYDYIEGRIRIARKYAYLALDDKYKKPSDPDIEKVLRPKEWFGEAPKQKRKKPEVPEPSDPAELNEMIASNPNLEKLVGDFALDINAEGDLPF